MAGMDGDETLPATMTQDLIQRKEEKKGSVLVDTVINVFFGPFIAIISP